MHRSELNKLDHPDVLRTLFHPRPQGETDPQSRAEEHFIPTGEDGVRLGARLHLAEPEAPNILFFHGNGEIAADWDDVGPLYTKRAISFLVVDYRGYGMSSGSPTATTLFRDSHAVFRHVRDWLRESGRRGPIFIMGRSLGSAPAIELAAAFPEEVKGLIIESGFAHTLPLLLTLGVDVHSLGITEGDGFGNARKIARVKIPTLILHGQFDQLIPVVSAEILQAASGAHSKEFQMIPGADHNTILEVVGERYFDVIKRFLNQVLRVRPKRYKKETSDEL